MNRVFFILLVAGICHLASPISQATIDTNNNGVTDLWERRYNSQQLFPPSFNLQADPDGDGWSNEGEATAGTDPFDANPPTGFLDPDVTHFPATYDIDPVTGFTEIVSPEIIAIAWPTIPGKQYTLFYSPELSIWEPLEEPYPGDGSTVAYHIPISAGGSTQPDRLFWRVGISDPVPEIDSDGDLLTDYEEHLAGTNPVISDSDADTLSDHAEIIAGTNPNNADEDGDGLTDPFELAAGTSSKNQDSDGDGIPDSTDAQPLVSAQAFPDADGDGIPDSNDPNPNQPRGPKPLIIANNAPGNPLFNVVSGEASKFLLTVSNSAGPAPTAPNFTLYLNGIVTTANITALAAPPAGNGSQSFLLTWNANVTTGYPDRTLQNITLRFTDAQNATSWLNLARVDVAEWEGVIAGRWSGKVGPGYQVRSHYRGVKAEPTWLVGDNVGRSIRYRGSKSISLLKTDGSDSGAKALISNSTRYPLFLFPDLSSAPQLIDVSSPVSFPDLGTFYRNASSKDVTVKQPTSMSLNSGTIGTTFAAFPQIDPRDNFNMVPHLSTYMKSNIESTIYERGVRYVDGVAARSMHWVAFYDESSWVRARFSSFELEIDARIVPHTAGTLEYAGLPLNTGSAIPLLPMASGTWHKIVLKVGPDAGAISNGVRLKLGSGEGGGGEEAPQPGFSLQVPHASGLSSLPLPANGEIDMSLTSDLYQKLVSPEGLTLFLKREFTVNEMHQLGLDLLARDGTSHHRMAALDLLPVEVNSMDRYLSGSIPESVIENFGGESKFGLVFRNPSSGETYSFNKLSEAHIYDDPFGATDEDEDKFLSNSEIAAWANGPSSASKELTQDVVFYRKYGKLHFRTLFDQAGAIEIGLIKDGQEIGKIDWTLKPDAQIADLLETVDNILSGNYDDGGGIIVAAMQAGLSEGDINALQSAAASIQSSNSSSGFGGFLRRNLTIKVNIPTWEALKGKIENGARKAGAAVDRAITIATFAGKGFCEGAWLGVKDDATSLVELGKMILNPAETAKTFYEGFKVLIELDLDGWKNVGKSLAQSFLEKGTEGVGEWGEPNAIDVASYLVGFTAGFITEQIAVTYVTAGILKAGNVGAKIGQFIRKASQGLLNGLAETAGNLIRRQTMKAKNSVFRRFSQDVLSTEDVKKLKHMLQELELLCPL